MALRASAFRRTGCLLGKCKIVALLEMVGDFCFL